MHLCGVRRVSEIEGFTLTDKVQVGQAEPPLRVRRRPSAIALLGAAADAAVVKLFGRQHAGADAAVARRLDGQQAIQRQVLHLLLVLKEIVVSVSKKK
jgi:hypothetical protein